MDRISVSELSRHTGAVLSRVRRGESLEVTVDGRPIARIVPVPTDSLADLVARGRVRPATGSGRIAVPTGEVDTEIDSTKVIAEQREDRL